MEFLRANSTAWSALNACTSGTESCCAVTLKQKLVNSAAIQNIRLFLVFIVPVFSIFLFCILRSIHAPLHLPYHRGKILPILSGYPSGHIDFLETTLPGRVRSGILYALWK